MAESELRTVKYHDLIEVITRVNMIYDYIQKIEKKVKTRQQFESEDMDHVENFEGWLSGEEVANALQINIRTLQRRMAERKIPFSRSGRTPMFQPQAINYALKLRLIKCDPQYAENFKINYVVDDE